MLTIRKAEEADFHRIMEIYRQARDFMIRSGNPDQWGKTFPPPELIRQDIRTGISRVLYDDRGLHGVFALIEGPDPTYDYIENGKWVNDNPYVTIHRIAGDGESHGIFRASADYCKQISKNVRIDTHAKNLPMQKQIEKKGFRKCGTIYVADGSPRIAYQWTAELPLPADL